MKPLIETAAKVAGRKAGECPDCTEGWVFPDDIQMPCPTCARLREIAEWKVHDHSIISGIYACNTCEFTAGTIAHVWAHEKRFNPTLDIPALRQLLEDLGETEKFLNHLSEKYIIAYHPTPAHKHLHCECPNISIIADILWDEQKSREAVQSYLTNLEVE
jgi:hypothetical protein